MTTAFGERGQKHEGYPSKPGGEFDQTLEHFKPRHRRHAYVAQYQVWRRLHDRQQALLTAVGDADFKTVIVQFFGYQRGGLTVIFDAQNSRTHVP
jgi:hypothetical protein